jgi:superfamily I DNA and RNA helicase
MLQIIHGQARKRTEAAALSEALAGEALTGTLYIGYPVLASADETLAVDALLICREHGLVAFSFGEAPPKKDETESWNRIRDEQDRLYFAVKTNLSRHPSLRRGRELAVPVETLTVFPAAPEPPPALEGTYADLTNLGNALQAFKPLDEPLMKPLEAALQRVSTIKPVKKRDKAKKPQSRGSILKKIEKEIANLDQWQKRAAIESPDSPQRIRGLAGSGKTIVLALKAAYLHAQHPEWKIAVTFHSRALYQQFQDLIRRFSFEHINDEPNWQNLRILHAWGGSGREGLYSEIAEHCDAPIRDFLYAKTRWNREDAFAGVCSELLAAAEISAAEPLYDAVLIDEAQDLPIPFFRLIHRFTREPKRIVWAYDELQKLSEAGMPTVAELFGRDENGNPRVHLVNHEGQPNQDLILRVCYRNTPWALTLAHALGLGIYRKEGLVQHFDEPTLWREIGYRLHDGELEAGCRVSLERDEGSYPAYFEELLDSADAVVSKTFADESEQARWVAQSVKRNLEEDELDHDDILVILPDAYTAKRKAALLFQAFQAVGVASHLAGVTSSRDEIFSERSIAIANIYRSKGNEAPMVYVLDCQSCVEGHELITLRNVLFTAITRSRAWVRLCGWGLSMGRLEREVREVRKRDFRLELKIPTPPELAKMRQLHRERTAGERARIKEAEKGLKNFVEALERGDLVLENLPPDLRTAITKLSRSVSHDEDDAA